MRVLVIPEDSRRDKGLLKPLIEAMMAAAGRPRAKVRVCEAARNFRRICDRCPEDMGRLTDRVCARVGA